MLLCAEYVLPITADPVERGAVLVRDGKIADIGPAEQLCLRYADEDVRDFGQAALIPGMVDASARLELGVLRGMLADKPYAEWTQDCLEVAGNLNAATLYDSALVECLELLAAGVTCVGTITMADSTLAAVHDAGLRGIVYREVSAMDARRVDYAMRSAAADVEDWTALVNSDLVTVGIAAAPVYTCHPKVYTRVAQFAGDELPVAYPLAASREEYDFVYYGRSPFSVEAMDRHAYLEVPPWLPTGASPVNYALNWRAFDAGNVMIVHGVHVSDDDIAQLRAYDVSVALCPRTNAFLGMGVAPVGEYLRAGLRMGVGTASPAAAVSVDMFAEMRTALQVQRSVNARDFLHARTMLELSTIGGARAMRMDDRIGSLEVGKQADLVAVDLSNSRAVPSKDPVAAVVSTVTSPDVRMTMVAGNVLYQDGAWNVPVDYKRAIERLTAVRTNLRAR